MTLCSHPDKPLIDHLEEVANNCKNIIVERTLFVNSFQHKEALQGIAYLVGAFHDLGKGTRFFQHYLLSENHEVKGPKSHALISAYFVKEIVRIYLKNTSLSDFEKKLFAQFAFTAVKRHHGVLKNFADEHIIAEIRVDELLKQIKVFDEEEISNIISHFLTPLNIKYDFQDFKKYILSTKFVNEFIDYYGDTFDSPSTFFNKLPIFDKIKYYYFHQLLFGALLLSDKRDVILEAERHAERPSIAENIINVFMQKQNFQKSDINDVKDKAFEAALGNLDKVFTPEKHIYSLTLPTGLGKTITSFAVAMQMKKMLNLSAQRVIITIPFTSIIDQNFEVYAKILDTNNSNILLKHHHLAEPAYKINEEEFDPDKSQFLIETWQSEVVVTTFVQLLNSIYSNDKSLLMKLPNLANSIIILDEIQTISYEHWQLIKNTFEVLGEIYNCYFILMSATQPLIFLPEKEIIEIVPNYEEYFGYFNRTKLFNRLQNVVTLSEFVDEVSSYLNENEKKDILIILNTKKDSKKCFELLRDLVDFENDDIYYLSTMITPFERKKIIGLIKTKSEKRKIVVSTQLIEAGVDISVDTVFRAIAPIDAIIQAAGRANRYQEKSNQGEVYLYEIEEMKKATSMIYGSLIQKTKNVLNEIDSIEEKDYLKLIKDYFIEIRKESDNRFSKYLKGISEFNFKDVGEFSLIEEREAESVFLQLNLDAKAIWEVYTKIWENPNLNTFQKKQEFAKIKAVFYDFVINVPKKEGQSINFDNEGISGFYLSTLENPSVFYSYDENDYSQNTGYQEVNTLSF